MRKHLILFLAGLLAGTLLLKVATNRGWVTSGLPVIKQDIGERPTIDAAETNRLRASRFDTLLSITAIQRLPRLFDRAEALHNLVGRSDPAKLQELLFEALRLRDPVWRKNAVTIILSGLTEIDPRSAVAIADSQYLRAHPKYASDVWSNWAHANLDDALLAAADVPVRDRSRVAQALYAGTGNAYNDAATRIKAALNVAPSDSNRRSFITRLADASPEMALEHVLSLKSGENQRKEMRWLGYALERKDAAMAIRLAEEISDPRLRFRYLSGIYRFGPGADRFTNFEILFSQRAPGKISKKEKAFAREIAEADLDRGLALLALTDDTSNRADLARVMAQTYATQRPADALAWAQTEQDGGAETLFSEVVDALALSHPSLALTAINELDDSSKRSALTMNLVKKIIADDTPANASVLMSQIKDASTQQRASVAVANAWLEQDAASAVNWVLSTTPEVMDRVLTKVRLIRKVDLEEAQLITTLLPTKYQPVWIRSVSARLVKEVSPNAARQFANQFANSDDYQKITARLAWQTASSDPGLARQWANELPQGVVRDATWSRMLETISETNPSQAMAEVEQIQDADIRQNATGKVLRQWRKVDTNAANSWLEQFPRGSERDILVWQLAMQERNPRSQQQLIQDIDDAAMRMQAELFNSLGNRKKNNSEEMLRQLNDIEMPAFFRSQIRAEIAEQAIR